MTAAGRAIANISTFLAVAMIAIIWLGATYHLTAERQIAQEAAIRHSGNLARAFEEHLIRSIKEVDRVLLYLRENYEESAAAFEFAVRKENDHFFSDLVTRVGIAGPDGRLVLSSAGPPPAPVDLRDREHFQIHINAGDDELFIGKPVISRGTGQWVIPLTRRIRSKDGSFGGVIAATIDTSYFTRIYNAINVGSDGAVALIGLDDGVFRASENQASNVLGRTVTDFVAYMSPLLAPDGWYFSDAAWNDGIRRLVSYRNVKQFPLVVLVGISDRQIFAGTGFKQKTYRGIALASTVLILLIVAFNTWKEINLARARSALASQNSRFDTALNNMSQGLCMFDADRRLVVCNDRYADMYRLPPDLLKAGTPQQAIIAYRVRHDLLKGEQNAAAVQRKIESMSERPAGARSSRIDELADGRLIRVCRESMAGGGWVATHEDITEQRRAELELDRTQKFLNTVIENMPVAIVVRELQEFRYTLVNRAAEDFLGVAREEMLGSTAYEIFRPEQAESITARDQEALQSSDQVAMQDHLVHTPRNGERVVTSRRFVARGNDGQPQYLINVIEDVTERKRAEQQIAYMAHHDALTGLPNRVLFNKRLDESLTWVRRDQSLAVLFLDLDHFKKVNDTLGHLIGDELLRAVADRLRSCVRETDTVARIGGDEFAIIQTAASEWSDVASLADRIHAAVKASYGLGNHAAAVDVSIGIALAPGDATESAELMKRADMALYRAKADGRGAYRFFEPEMDARMKARRKLEVDLRDAIVNGTLELIYQPFIRLQDNRIVGYEALLRWRDPAGSVIEPAYFIPAAEETGLIIPLGEWAIRQACSDAAKWPGDIKVAINLSPVQFRSQNLLQIVISALAESGVAPGRLELEITESVLMSRCDETLAVLRQLRELGASVVLDDFGTGYSSLSYLRDFPIDKVKIDKSFISEMTRRDDCAAIVCAVANLGTLLKIVTTAEGIETDEQLALVRAAGCSQAQGYLIGRPGPVSQPASDSAVVEAPVRKDLAMAPTDMMLVRAGFLRLVHMRDAASDLFYNRLFEIAPELRVMFPQDLGEQKRKLMAALGVIVGHLDDPAMLIPSLKSLGAQHAGAYGVKPDHYAFVGQALLWTIESGLGGAFTPEMRSAWDKVYEALAATMQAGAAEAAAVRAVDEADAA